jgi:hypothetical protein
MAGETPGVADAPSAMAEVRSGMADEPDVAEVRSGVSGERPDVSDVS